MNCGMNSRNCPTSTFDYNFYVELWNAFSVVNKTKYIFEHLSDLKVNLLFITETWLNDKLCDSYVCPRGYQVLRKNRKSSKGGGVMLIYKSNLQIRLVELDTTFITTGLNFYVLIFMSKMLPFDFAVCICHLALVKV